MAIEEQKQEEMKIKELEEENEMLKIEVDFLKSLIPSDTKGDPTLEILSKYQKALAELNILRIKYHTIIAEAELERQRCGSVERKKKIDERMESMRISDKKYSF